MPLVGGGGAGNVAGGNPAGTGTGLNYIGDHAYAYSGSITAANSSSADTTMLDFSTGQHFVVGTVAFQTTEHAANIIYFEVLVNGESIIAGAWDNSGSGQASANTPIDLVLPSFSRIQVKWGISGGSGANGTAQISGRTI